MQEHPEHEPVQRSAAAMREAFGEPPHGALVLGSGLGLLVEQLTDPVDIPFPALGLPGSTVPGHAGRMVVGRFGEVRVATMCGRVHLYEGYSASEVVRAIRALKVWGVQWAVITNSAGGITPGRDPGTLALLTDHLNFQGGSPLVGPAYGTRFPDMSNAYDPDLRSVLTEVAKEQGTPLPEAIYAAMLGPAYETPAEIRFLRTIGADLVGMSTVPEVLAAAECGLRVAAISVVSNRAAGLGHDKLDHAEVTEAAALASKRFGDLLREAVKRIG